jgi:hypothetical protein
MNRQRLRVSILESRLRGSVTTALASPAGHRMWRETLTVWVMSPDHRDDRPTGQLGQPDLHDAGDVVAGVIPVRFIPESAAQMDRLEHLDADLRRKREMRQRDRRQPQRDAERQRQALDPGQFANRSNCAARRPSLRTKRVSSPPVATTGTILTLHRWASFRKPLQPEKTILFRSRHGAQGLDVAAGIDQRRAATFEDVLDEGVGGRDHAEFAGQLAQDQRRRDAWAGLRG